MKKIIIFLFMVSELYSSGTKSGTIFNLNPLPVDAGLNVLCYAESTPLESLVYNPAYAVPDNYSFGVSTELMPLDMYYGSVIYMGGAPFDHGMGLGGMVKYFTSGDILKFDGTGQHSGGFNVDDFMFSGVWATEWYPGFFTGIRLNVLKEKIVQSKTGVSFDAGLGYDTAFFTTQRIVFGFTVMNIGTKLYGEPQAIGIGTGILLENVIAHNGSIQYGIGFRWRSGLDYDVGPAIRYNGRIKMGRNKSLRYKIGVGYYYNQKVKQNGFLQGLKMGISIDSSYNIILGYQLASYPWGMSNKLFIGYRIMKDRKDIKYGLPEKYYKKVKIKEEGADIERTIRCPKCGKQIPAKAKFCPECGAKILKEKKEEKSPKYCPNCGNRLEPGVKFCPKCGYKVKK